MAPRRQQQQRRRRASTSVPTHPLLLLLFLFLLMPMNATKAAAFKLDPIVMIMMGYSPLETRQVENLQTFREDLGGAAAPEITNTGDVKRPYGVDGDTFPDFPTAAERSCDNQFNECQKIANSNQQTPFNVKDCEAQQSRCRSAQKVAAVTTFPATTATSTFPVPMPQQTFHLDDEFDIVCDREDL